MYVLWKRGCGCGCGFFFVCIGSHSYFSSLLLSSSFSFFRLAFVCALSHALTRCRVVSRVGRTWCCLSTPIPTPKSRPLLFFFWMFCCCFYFSFLCFDLLFCVSLTPQSSSNFFFVLFWWNVFCEWFSSVFKNLMSFFFSFSPVKKIEK